MACYLLTLTSKNTPYRLSDLIAEKNARELKSFRFISLQADPENTDTIFGGDALIDTDSYGWWLTKDSPPRIYQSEQNNTGTIEIWVECFLTDGQKIAVELKNA